MENKEINQVLALLKKSEYLGENVLRDKSEIVQMDRIRQKNREALTALKKRDEDDNVYLCVGNMFFKHRIRRARELIQADQTSINEQIENLRRKMKNDVQQVQELEGRIEETHNLFNLTPLDPNEMRSINVVLNSIKSLDLEK